jgi:hypothetical protein
MKSPPASYFIKQAAAFASIGDYSKAKELME